MRPRDLLGYLGQRGITCPGIFEAVFSDRDDMGTTVPFANKTCSRL